MQLPSLDVFAHTMKAFVMPTWEVQCKLNALYTSMQLLSLDMFAHSMNTFVTFNWRVQCDFNAL